MEQGGLPRPVFADEPDSILVAQVQLGMMQHALRAERYAACGEAGEHLAGRGRGVQLQGAAALLLRIERLEAFLGHAYALVHLGRKLARLAVLSRIDGELDLRTAVAVVSIEMPRRASGGRSRGHAVAPHALGLDARQLAARLPALGSHGILAQLELPARLGVRPRNSERSAGLDEHARPHKLVEQRAIVRYEQADALEGGERLRDEGARGSIEVVRRLVERQHLRFCGKRARDLDALALAMGQHSVAPELLVLDFQ